MGLRKQAEEIRIWRYSEAPEHLRMHVPGAGEWLAYLPKAVATEDVEGIFLRWHSPDHPIAWQRLRDGSLVIAGSSPLTGEPAPVHVNVASAQPARRLVRSARSDR